MTFSWILRLPYSMAPAEAVHRMGALIKKASARGLAEGWERYAAPGAAPGLPTLRDVVADAPPDVRESIRKAADALIAGRFSALGRDWPRRWPGTPLSPELWRLDPVTGRLWPGRETYTFDILYRRERRLGDIKYVWEINRLQLLQPLAAAVLLEGDRAALNLIEETIASWHDANPPFRGVAWSSGIECALRAISLIVVASLAGARLSRETIARLRAMLTAHAFWIARFPSRFSAANNNLVAEAAAELLIALAMPDLSQAPEREARARAVLAREATRQILADGSPAEQSPACGAFTAELLLLATFAARAAGRPRPTAVDRRLAAFARLVGWIADASGRVPAIGDDDESRVLSLAGHEPAHAMSVACAIAGFAGETPPGLRLLAAHLRDAVFGAPADVPLPPQGLQTFPDGGLSVVRETRAGRDLGLLLDHGPLGYLSTAAHGHADALSLWVSLDGRPLLADPGTYLSHSGGAWPDWFRGTPAHSTLNIGGISQSEIAGPFQWGRKARAKLDEARDGEDWLLRASHDGYVGAFGVTHERTVAAAADGFTVRDRLLGTETPLAVEIVFQLAPDCEAALDDRTVTVQRPEGAPVRIVFETPGAIALARGGSMGAGGWVSPAFGIKVPAWRITWRGRIASTGALARFVLS